VDSAAQPRDLALVAWEPHALAAGLTLRRVARGYLLERADAPPFAWLDDLARTNLAPRAATAAGTLAMGGERDAPGRFEVVDQRGAQLVSIAPRRQWLEVDLEPASGGRLRLSTLVVERGWVARDEAHRTVMRVVSRAQGAARLTLVGDVRTGVELPTILAVAYAVLLSDELPSPKTPGAKPS
jgi:hypothetical protein